MNIGQVKEIKRILGVNLTARLLNLSPKTVQNYKYHKMSKKVKSRMNIIIDIVEILKKSHNESGVSIWFEEPFLILENKSPVDYLGKDWESESGKEKVKKVFLLAMPVYSSSGT